MADLDPGLLRQRRNLLAFSIAIILYVAAGADEPEKITILSGSVEFERIWVLYLFVGIGYLYSVWRYWLYAKPVLTKFQADYLVQLRRDSIYIEKARLLYDRSASLNNDNVFPMIRWEKLSPFFDFSQKIRLRADGHSYWTAFPSEQKEPIDFTEAVLIITRNGARAVIHGKAFSDLMLPYFLATGALIAIVFKIYQYVNFG